MYEQRPEERIRQGDMFENIEFEFPKVFPDSIEIQRINLSYAVALSQECDLEQDYKNRTGLISPDNQDKFLKSILLSPAYLAEEFRYGTHLTALGLTAQKWNRDSWRGIIRNQHARFQFLPEDSEYQLPALIMDFKHYYTVSPEDSKLFPENNYKVTIQPLYRESLSQRFAYYLSRIGLPESSVQETQSPEQHN